MSARIAWAPTRRYPQYSPLICSPSQVESWYPPDSEVHYEPLGCCFDWVDSLGCGVNGCRPATQKAAGRIHAIGPLCEVHAPLLRSPASKDAATLTERVATSLSGQAAPLLPTRNFIDEQIFGKMERERIPHAPLASDYEFLRRVTLDLTGRIPSSEDVRISSAIRIRPSATA